MKVWKGDLVWFFPVFGEWHNGIGHLDALKYMIDSGSDFNVDRTPFYDVLKLSMLLGKVIFPTMPNSPPAWHWANTIIEINIPPHSKGANHTRTKLINNGA